MSDEFGVDPALTSHQSAQNQLFFLQTEIREMSTAGQMFIVIATSKNLNPLFKRPVPVLFFDVHSSSLFLNRHISARDCV